MPGQAQNRQVIINGNSFQSPGISGKPGDQNYPRVVAIAYVAPQQDLVAVPLIIRKYY